jgi:hypothetical protein
MLCECFPGHQDNINKLLAALSSRSIEEIINATALVKHTEKTGHKINLGSTKILKQCSNGFKLPIFEMLEINYLENAVKFKTDTKNLSRSYIAIVDDFKRILFLMLDS